ncbi:Sperm flagelar-like protein [Carpediemonas membranifera]|uniref:Sperm flagelar-like protein n=1 Tax=Carpediemonas membranifera TaxID=201153 RepID=A0A8J6AU15_9EUKA|nr:Sperm flagelar-like protein [Carpediemonas membranifera]|eukprot:KAG9391515.1 Sperm flagelar-like protein [Carpediemonas membranifera]
MELTSVYLWVDKFKFSRGKSNISRDFSDARSFAELVEQIQPSLATADHYPEAFSILEKEKNWRHASEKILAKLGIELTEEEVAELAGSTPGAIENFLFLVRPSLESYVPRKRNIVHRESAKPKSYIERHMTGTKQVSAGARSTRSQSPRQHPKASRPKPRAGPGIPKPRPSPRPSSTRRAAPMPSERPYPARSVASFESDDSASSYHSSGSDKEIERDFDEVSTKGGPTIEAYIRMKHELDEKMKLVALLEEKNRQLQRLARVRGDQVELLKRHLAGV